MPQPKSVAEAKAIHGVHAASLTPYERAIVNKLHGLVCSEFKCNEANLFGIFAFERDKSACAALAYLLEKYSNLKAARPWIATYLWCSLDEVHVHIAHAEQLVLQEPEGVFAVRVQRVWNQASTHATLTQQAS